MLEKVKSIASKVTTKGKMVMASTVAAICAVAPLGVIANAEEPTTSEVVSDAAPTMEAMLSDAGSQLTSQFSSLVSTIIPVVLGILGSGLVIFGIFALIRFAKKIFAKVAG